METENNQEVQPEKRTLTNKIGIFIFACLCLITLSLFFTFKDWWSGLIWAIIFVLLIVILDNKFEKSFNKELSFTISFSITLILSIFVLKYSLNSKRGIYDTPASSSNYSSSGERCLNCNNPISGKGFNTVGGEEYACTDSQCYYCSRSCAKASRPKGW